jgi:hypothetical protein
MYKALLRVVLGAALSLSEGGTPTYENLSKLTNLRQPRNSATPSYASTLLIADCAAQ